MISFKTCGKGNCNFPHVVIFTKLLNFLISCLQNRTPSLGRNCCTRSGSFPVGPFWNVSCFRWNTVLHLHSDNTTKRKIRLCSCLFGFFKFFFSSSVHIFKRVVLPRTVTEDASQVAEPSLLSLGCWCCSQHSLIKHSSCMLVVLYRSLTLHGLMWSRRELLPREHCVSPSSHWRVLSKGWQPAGGSRRPEPGSLAACSVPLALIRWQIISGNP